MNRSFHQALEILVASTPEKGFNLFFYPFVDSARNSKYFCTATEIAAVTTYRFVESGSTRSMPDFLQSL